MSHPNYPQHAPEFHPPHPGPAAQPPGSVARQSYLRITAQGSNWKSFVPPTITIDGYPIPSRYGTVDVPVTPGWHRVEGSGSWLWTYGRAALDVLVQPGQVVPVFYSAPYATWSRGSIGHVPQETRGIGVLIGAFAVVVVFVVFIVLMAAFS